MSSGITNFETNCHFLEVVCHHATVALFLVDAQQHCIYLNSAAEALTGYTLAELRDQPFHQKVHHRWIEQSHSLLKESASYSVFWEKEQTQGKAVWVHKDGRCYPIAYIASSIEDDTTASALTLFEVRNIAEQIKIEEEAWEIQENCRLATQRKQAEEALRTSEQRLRLALAATQMVAWEYNPTTGQVVTSGDINKLLGLPAGGVLENSDQGYALIHPEDVEEHRTKVIQAILDCGSYRSVYRHLRSDTGEILWLEESGQALSNEAGETSQLVGVVVNVTDRKQAEDALRASESKYRNLFENMAEEVHFWQLVRDDQGEIQTWRLVDANPAALKTWGRTLHDIQGKTTDEIFGSGATAHYLTVVKQIFVEQTSYSFEDYFPNLDKHFRFTSVPVGDDHFITTGADISLIKKANESLQSSEERLRLALQAGRTGVWEWNLASNFISWSEETYTIFGIQSGQFNGQFAAFMLRVHPEDQDYVQSAIRTSIQEGCPYTHQFRIIRADNHQVRWVTNLGVVRTNQAGRRIAMIGTVTDVTEEYETKEALREADRRKDEFLATLAHELRNPLAPIRTGLSILKLTPEGPTAIKSREIMERQLSHMVRLIDDLLDLSRISRGKITLKLERLKLQTVIETAIETSRPMIEAGRHELTVSFPERDIWIDADLTRLSQIVGNILTNAAKYTPERGQIRLTVCKEAQNAVVTVADNGIGIPPDMISRVFEMFTQVDNLSNKAKGGLGIGLALVKRLTEMHGGTIMVESPGTNQGSTFTLRLPLPMEVQQTGLDTASEAEGSASIHLRILVVDDNRDGAESLAMLLSLHEHEVRIVQDGPDAISAAAEFKPNLVFLDIGLPTLNGYEVAQVLRNDSKQQGIILVALTGWGSEEDKQRSREAGFDFHLTKPAAPEEIEEILNQIEGIHRG